MSFDLNIENYKKGELEEIFNLKSGQYDSNTIEQKCTQLRDNVSSDKSIEQNVRMKTIIFLDEAKRVLASQLNSSNVVQKLANAYNMNPNLVDSGVIDANDRVHLLGCAAPQEFLFHQNYPFIESIDTSNPIMAAMEDKMYKEHGLDEKPITKIDHVMNRASEDINWYALHYNVNKFRKINRLDKIVK